MKAKLAKALKIIKSYIPEALPQTEASHIAWTTELLEVAGLPDNASFRIAVSGMVLHLNSGTIKASKQGFIKQLKRSIANQSAYNVMDDLKRQEKQKELDEQRELQEASGQVVPQA